VIKNNKTRVEKKLWTDNPEGQAIQVFESTNETEEAQKITDEVQCLARDKGLKLNDFAVFYRTNAQSRVMEDAFRRAGIPYSVVGTVRFYERAEVKDIMAYLRLVHNPNDNVSFKRVINVPRRGIGKTSMEALESKASDANVSLWGASAVCGYLPPSARRAIQQFRALIDEIRREKEHLTVKQVASMVIDKTSYMKELEAEDSLEAKNRMQNIYELISAIDEFEQKSFDKSLSGYLTQVSLVSDIDEWAEETDRVTMMTLHLAKGLEFNTVFVAGLEEGLFPIGEASFDEEELEEERRLMYVGMTRAKENLYLSWAAERKIYGKSRWNLQSRFIQEAGFGTGVTLEVSAAPEKRRYRSGNSGDESGYERGRAAEDKSSGAYSLGTRVRHQQFGDGKVIDRSGAGEDLKLVILFDTGQWKKLVVKYANLEVI
jgi:DNA helicase-2/ATP-dependent DNA helicase PcrA